MITFSQKKIRLLEGELRKNAVNDFDYALLSRTEFTRGEWEDVVLSITKGCCYLLLLCHRK